MNYSTDSIHRNEDQPLPYSGGRRRGGEGGKKKRQEDLRDEVHISSAAREALEHDGEDEETPSAS